MKQITRYGKAGWNFTRKNDEKAVNFVSNSDYGICASFFISGMMTEATIYNKVHENYWGMIGTGLLGIYALRIGVLSNKKSRSKR